MASNTLNLLFFIGGIVASTKITIKLSAEEIDCLATFEEKHDLISMLGIKVYPSEDFKIVRIKSKINLNINSEAVGVETVGSSKVPSVPPNH